MTTTRLLILVPILLGAMTAGQGALSRQVARQVGLAAAVLISTLCVCACVLFLVVMVQIYPSLFPAFFRAPPGWRQHLGWWYWIPGVLGSLFIVGIPWTIHHMGATHTFLLAIVGQIGFSVLWDRLSLGVQISWVRAAGVLMVAAGATLVVKGR